MAHAGRGEALWSLGRHREAVDAYGRAIGLDSDCLRAANGHALALLELGAPGRAIDALPGKDGISYSLRNAGEVIELNPDDAKAHRTLVLALLAPGAPDPAAHLATIDRAIALDPGNARAHHARGHALCALGCHAYGLAEYDRAIALDPDHAGAHHARGVALGKLGRHDEALGAIRRALEIDGSLPGAPLDEGRALSALGRHDEALAAYDRALAAAPRASASEGGLWKDIPAGQDSPQACVAHGLALDGLGRHDEALDSYGLAARLDPDPPKAHRDEPRVHGFRSRGWLKYEKAVAVASARLARGVALGKLGRHDVALDEYSRVPESSLYWGWDGLGEKLLNTGLLAHQMTFEHIQYLAHTGRVDALRELGRHEDALAEYDRMIGDGPGNATEHRGRADALRELGRHDDAHDADLEADRLVPGRASAHRARGAALLGLGRHDEALEAIRRALEIDGSLPGASLEEGRALSALGRHDEALAAYDREIAIARRSVAASLDIDEERAEWYEVITFSPDWVVALRARGAALRELGRHDEALDAHVSTMAFGEDDPAALRARATALHSIVDLGGFDSRPGYNQYSVAALAAYDRAIELEPDCATVHRDRATLLLSLDRKAAALAALDRAVELEPRDSEAHALRALLLGALGLHAEAEAARRSAVSTADEP